MRRIIRRKKSSYALGLTLCFIGFIVLFIVLWKAWPNVSASPDVLSALWTYLWTEQPDLTLWVGLKLIYYAILGASTLIFGTLILALSRQWFPLAGETVLLQCSFCNNQWKGSRAKGWCVCPHCRQFVHPKVTEAKS